MGSVGKVHRRHFFISDPRKTWNQPAVPPLDSVVATLHFAPAFNLPSPDPNPSRAPPHPPRRAPGLLPHRVPLPASHPPQAPCLFTTAICNLPLPHRRERPGFDEREKKPPLTQRDRNPSSLRSGPAAPTRHRGIQPRTIPIPDPSPAALTRFARIIAAACCGPHLLLSARDWEREKLSAYAAVCERFWEDRLVRFCALCCCC
jgi:hypothetical protein